MSNPSPSPPPQAQAQAPAIITVKDFMVPRPATNTIAPTPTSAETGPPLTFQERLRTLLNGPYTVNMRRSVQTCVLIEADRCLKMQYDRLKAFQRKVALHDTAADIVDSLTFIPPHCRIEIMYRTATSKVILSPELSWRRMKLIDREIKKTIVPKIMELSTPGKTHTQLCEMYLQREYEIVTGKKDPHHANWEYSHDNHFTAYRMFYIGNDLNPNLPPAIDPNPHRVVPSVKPRPEMVEAQNLKRVARAAAVALHASNVAAVASAATSTSSFKRQKKDFTEVTSLSSSLPLQNPYKPGPIPHQQKAVVDDATERRALLKEIKEHIDILNEFKGIIDDEELAKRKKSLFELLPKP